MSLHRKQIRLFPDSALYLSVRLAGQSPSDKLENVLCKPGVLEENSPKNHIFILSAPSWLSPENLLLLSQG